MAEHPRAAEVFRDGDRWVLTMTREFSHPIEQVWSMLTDPQQLARWSPIVADRPLTSPGPATARESVEAPAVDAEVLVANPPRELVHRWGPDLLRWRLEPSSQGTVLRLDQALADVETRTFNATGWHLLFSVLDAVLDGEQVDRVVGRDAMRYDIQALREEYAGVLDRGGLSH